VPQGRIILKSISESKKLAMLKTDGARLLYTWLIPHLDINGCFSGDPKVVNGKVVTRLNKGDDTIEGYLQDLEENKLIQRFNHDGDIFLYVPDFTEKQPRLYPEKEGKPLISRVTPELLQGRSRVTLPQVKESKVKESKVNISEKTAALMKQVEKTGFAIYKFNNKLKKKLKAYLPEEVIVKVCETYLHSNSKGEISNKWGYFVKSCDQAYKDFNRDKNIQQAQDLAQIGVSEKLKGLLAGIGDVK